MNMQVENGSKLLSAGITRFAGFPMTKHLGRDDRQDSGESSREKNAAWCIVDFADHVFQAKVVHLGRGKFLIMKDNQNEKYAGKVLDASNILVCDVGLQK